MSYAPSTVQKVVTIVKNKAFTKPMGHNQFFRQYEWAQAVRQTVSSHPRWQAYPDCYSQCEGLNLGPTLRELCQDIEETGSKTILWTVPKKDKTLSMSFTLSKLWDSEKNRPYYALTGYLAGEAASCFSKSFHTLAELEQLEVSNVVGGKRYVSFGLSMLQRNSTLHIFDSDKALTDHVGYVLEKTPERLKEVLENLLSSTEISEDMLLKRLTARDASGLSALGKGIKEGKTDAVKTFVTTVLNSAKPSELKYKILSETFGHSLTQSEVTSNTLNGLIQYSQLVLNSDKLKFSDKQKLLSRAWFGQAYVDRITKQGWFASEPLELVRPGPEYEYAKRIVKPAVVVPHTSGSGIEMVTTPFFEARTSPVKPCDCRSEILKLQVEVLSKQIKDPSYKIPKGFQKLIDLLDTNIDNHEDITKKAQQIVLEALDRWTFGRRATETQQKYNELAKRFNISGHTPGSRAPQ